MDSHTLENNHPKKITPPLYGLILAGGESRRMGRDKALLNYHGQPQGRYLYSLLSRFCKKVMLSCRTAQWETAAFQEAFAEIPVIPDAYADIGPLSGLLSAMEANPGPAWLVLACDMPLVNEALLARLCTARNPDKRATVFIRPAASLHTPTGEQVSDKAPEKLSDDFPGFPEPLCAIYEPTCLPWFQAGVKAGQTGLSSFLAQWRAADQVTTLPLIPLPLDLVTSTLQSQTPDGVPDEIPDPLLNLNTPEEQRLFFKRL